ncbi:MAG: hypothetical protein IPL69_17920 [Saprospiraceae bacterium]|nr:hypothetical protein [Candidatus Brachybacter algidus]
MVEQMNGLNQGQKIAYGSFCRYNGTRRNTEGIRQPTHAIAAADLVMVDSFGDIFKGATAITI